MERETFVSGYCRRMDGSRMVEVILVDGRVTEVDCAYGTCLYQSGCPIAAQIQALESQPA